MDNPSLHDALDETAGQQPEVMPTAPILKQEYDNVNKVVENSSENTEKPVKLNKDGTPRKKYTRKGETAKAAGFVGGTEKPQAAPQMQHMAGDAKRRLIAKVLVSHTENVGVAIAGQTGKMATDEKMELIGATDEYLMLKNLDDVPPSLVLLGAFGMYFGRVLQAEDENKIPVYAKIAFWVKYKIMGLFKGKGNARTDSRDDRKRENNAG